MPLDFIDLVSVIITFLSPLAVIGLAIFMVIKLNSIEKSLVKLEKSLNEMNNHKIQ